MRRRALQHCHSSTATTQETREPAEPAAVPHDAVQRENISKWRTRQTLLDWRLRLHERADEDAFWEAALSTWLLPLDRVMLLLHLLALFSAVDTKMERIQAAVHAGSLALLIAQAASMLAGLHAYRRARPALMLMQRLLQTGLRAQALRLGTALEMTGGSSAAAFVDAALAGSGVVSAWVAWGLAPFGTAPLTLGVAELTAAAVSAAPLLRRLGAPELVALSAHVHSVAGAASGAALLPLLPPAATAVWRGECPVAPQLPMLLWLQLFAGLAAPVYVSWHVERAAKVRFWLRLMSHARPAGHGPVAEAAQRALRAAAPPAALLRHLVTLLLISALAWRVCDLLYWALPPSWFALLP